MAGSGNHDIPAVVFGGYKTALGVVRSLGRAGVPQYLVSETPDFAGRSRWARRFPEGLPVVPSPSDIDDLLAALPLDEAVLIPCSDHWTRALTTFAPPPGKRFRTSLPSGEVNDLLADKKTLSALLDRLDIAQPRTVPVASQDDLDAAMSGETRDWFLKPCDSQAFRQHFGCKAYRVESREEAGRILARVAEAGLEVLLQEYVPGGADRHYFVDGFVDRHGAIRALFARRRKRMFPVDFGDSSYMASVPLDETAEAVAGIRTLFADTPYRGIFSVEFKRDPRDGRFRLIEVNTRPWAMNEFATNSGVDVILMSYRDALGEDVPETASYQVGRRSAVLFEDVSAGFKLIRRGELGLGEWLGDQFRSEWTLFSWDDPLPDLARHAGSIAEKFRG